jgi:hypothetical protein
MLQLYTKKQLRYKTNKKKFNKNKLNEKNR